MIQAVYLNIHFDLFSENELYEGKELLLEFGINMMISCTIEAGGEMDRSGQLGGYLLVSTELHIGADISEGRKNTCT